MAISDSERISLTELEELNQRFETSTPQEILTWVNNRFETGALQMSSFGMDQSDVRRGARARGGHPCLTPFPAGCPCRVF